MKHGMLVLPVDGARQILDVIGASTKLHFEDMNTRSMQRPYRKYIQRVDEMERIIRFMLEELTRIPEAQVITSNVESFLENAGDYKLDEVETQIKKAYKDFTKLKENTVQLTVKRNAALEER